MFIFLRLHVHHKHSPTIDCGTAVVARFPARAWCGFTWRKGTKKTKIVKFSSLLPMSGMKPYFWDNNCDGLAGIMLHWTWLLSLCLSLVPFLGQGIIQKTRSFFFLESSVIVHRLRSFPRQSSSTFENQFFDIYCFEFLLFLAQTTHFVFVSLSLSLSLSIDSQQWSNKRITQHVTRPTKPTVTASNAQRSSASATLKARTQNSSVTKDGQKETTARARKLMTRNKRLKKSRCYLAKYNLLWFVFFVSGIIHVSTWFLSKGSTKD